jgi:hypothetical protein
MASRANFWFGFGPGASWPSPIWPIDRPRRIVAVADLAD